MYIEFVHYKIKLLLLSVMLQMAEAYTSGNGSCCGNRVFGLHSAKEFFTKANRLEESVRGLF